MHRKWVCTITAALLLSLAGSALGQPGIDGWWTETIGGGTAGSATIKTGTYTVTGAGADIWGNADQFHFLYRQLTGDGSITARVVSTGAGANTWAKGGVMIRDDNSSGAMHGMSIVSANSDGTAGNGACYQWRPTTGGTSSSVNYGGTPAAAAPYWTKIERIGNQFSAYLSADGKTWTQTGTAQTITMQDPVLIGLCATSHVAGTLRTYTFDNVSYTGNVTPRPPQTKATNPNPANGAVGVATPLVQWSPGETAVFHDIYFGTSPELTEADLKAPKQTYAMYFYPLEFTPGKTYYWRVDEIDAAMAVHKGDTWKLTAATLAAYSPLPPDGAKYQPTDADLSWQPGQNAVSHEVYFGTDKDAVANAQATVFKGKQAPTRFEPGVLAMNTTYYWRIDETDVAGQKHVGPVWSFTTTIPGLGAAKRELWNNITGSTVATLTADVKYPGAPDAVAEMPDFESPAGIGDNYGGRLSAWLHVPATGDYTFWIASDDNGELRIGPDQDSAAVVATVPGYSNAREWDKFSNQKSALIHLEAGRYYIEALWKDATGGDNCSVAWQGPGMQQRTLISGSYLASESFWAYSPRPVLGAKDVSHTPELRWTAGIKAKQHDVYFGEDADAVAAATPATAGIYRGQQALDQTTFDPGELEWGKTYSWRVDEINPAEAGSPWQGAVWSFTTANFLVVDDMESYTDEEPARIFDAWLDGYADQSSGSIVGYMDARNGTFGETTIVHGGRQSMPFEYDNSKAPYYSEAEQEFAPVQNWTANGVSDLVLYVRGYPAAGTVAVTETAGKISVTGAGADIWNNSDEFTYVYKPLNGDGVMTARVVSTGTGTNTWAKGGVMIRDSLNGGSTHAFMPITGGGGNGASFQYRATANGASANTDSTAVLAPPYWVKIERAGDNLTGYVSPDGKSWNMLGTTTITMNAPVYIGLAVTSHAAGTGSDLRVRQCHRPPEPSAAPGRRGHQRGRAQQRADRCT